MKTIFNFSGRYLLPTEMDDAMVIIDVNVEWSGRPDVAQVEAALTAAGYDVARIVAQGAHIAIALPSWLPAAAAVARALPNAEIVP